MVLLALRGIELRLVRVVLVELRRPGRLEVDGVDDVEDSLARDLLEDLGDPFLGVVGAPLVDLVDGLRVIDVAITPDVPRANTNLTAIMLAERLAPLLI